MKKWEGTRSEQILDETVLKASPKEKRIDIFNKMMANEENRRVFEADGRLTGDTKEWKIYRRLCTKMQNT